VTDHGWLESALRLPSPNFDARPPGVAVDLLVLHNISLPPGQFGGGFVQQLFTNRLDLSAHPFFGLLGSVRVSSHFLIERDGRLTQFVSCLDRAWHAGASSFAGRGRCNDFSIGVELEGTDFTAFEPAQYAVLAQLTRALAQRFALCAVRGHAHISPGRKSDPGPFFDWPLYARASALDAALWPVLGR